MDVGTAMSVVQTLMAALQCPELKEICSIAGYKSQLKDLEGTVNVIKDVLQDAERKQVLSNQEQGYIENLKDVLDEADNLFDEFVTQAEAERKKHSKHGIKNRLSSVFSKYGLAFQMSQKAKKVKAKLDQIAYNKQFNFKLDPAVPIHKIDRETCSLAPEEIIGRKDDLEALMGMLLDRNVDRDVSFLSIVGIGGLGKTALAQLVYNDPRVKDAFPLRMWTCVSDEDPQEKLNVKAVLCRILDQKTEGCTLETVQGQLRNKLEGKKYLLVLDDVWTEDRNRLGELVGYLKKGGRGSWIVVTTRSQKTATLEPGGKVHKLSGLSAENSWRLLKRKAFGSEDSSQPEDLRKIGQVIVEKCAYVPLAIRVVGSLLNGRSKLEWQSFREFGLANIKAKEDGIMPILKISYHQLDSPLKSCFSYCVLFSKDERIGKEHLIQLWIAQGYITSSGLKSMEEVAEDYVLILIDRGFFQDVDIEKDTETIKSFKMHDLMHDVAQEVAKKEICRARSFDGDEHNKIRHISLVKKKDAKLTFASKTHVRSFLQATSLLSGSMFKVVIDPGDVDALLNSCKFLRALDLRDLGIRSLPESIGDLLHLRYLDVSDNTDLEVLPRKITRLYNLQVLKLGFCFNLKELPKDMSRLDKLRVLDITSCSKLTQMPRSISKLKCLHTLTDFVMKEVSSSKELLDAMEDLKGLVNLKGRLHLEIELSTNGPEFEKENGREGGYLRNKEYLDSVMISLDYPLVKRTRLECLKAVAEELQPHHNLKNLDLMGLRDEIMPIWAVNLVAKLPNLVKLSLRYCLKLKTLECLGNLRHLEYLSLHSLNDLEFISNMTYISGASSSSTSNGFSFFPSLKMLFFENLPNLQTWGNDELLCLPQLKILNITGCPSLAVILQCPLLESLILSRFNNRLQIVIEKMMNKKELEDVKGKGKEANISKLREVNISNVEWLKLLSIGENKDKQVKNLEDIFHVCSDSQFLSISACENLTSVSGGPKHLEALKRLHIESCPNLIREEGIGMPWPSLGHSLQSLELIDLPQLVSLPSQMQYLTALQILRIKDCKRLETLPNWMDKLTSLNTLWLNDLPQLVSLPNQMQYLTALRTLIIQNCKRLEYLPNWMDKLISLRNLHISKCSATLHERCQGSTGQDWPHIAHIPSIFTFSE